MVDGRRGAQPEGESLRLLGQPGEPRVDYAVHGCLTFLDAACLRWAERGYPPHDREPLTDQATGTLAVAGHPTALYPGLDAAGLAPAPCPEDDRPD